jgi:taurine dioxygenase
MAFTIKRLSDELSFGCVVTGLTPSDLNADVAKDELRRAWAQHGVVVFRGAKVTPDFQVELSECFAPTIMHPVREIRHPDNDKLIRLVSDPQGEDENVIEVDGKVGCGYLPWHKDIVFTPKLNHGGILRATKVPSTGGETGYLDQIDAYNRLDEATKAQIERLEVIYKLVALKDSPWGTRQNVKWLKTGPQLRSLLARSKDWPAVVHPLVFVQPATGRKVLNLSPEYAQGILGMDKAEGDALLTKLVNHLWDSPAYFHKWHEDEMVLWDNWRMLHCVTPAPYEEVRIVERTTLDGDYGLGRKLEDATVLSG